MLKYIFNSGVNNVIFYKEKTDKENIEEVIRYNLKQTSKIKEEIRKLTKIDSSKVKVTEISKVVEHQEVKVESEELEEYTYYYYNIIEDLKKCKTLDEKKKCIYEDLPTFDNKNYTNIVKRIIAEFYYEINEYKIMMDEYEDLKDDANKQIESLIEVIAIIRSHIKLLDKKDILKEEPKHNKIVFFPRLSTDTPYILSDIASVPTENYDDFKVLLESIEYGTFKNVKQFSTNNNVLKGIFEVRLYQARVVAERIDKDVYVVIKAFIKKSDCDNGYLEQLKKRVDYYKKNKNPLISRINESFLEEQKSIYDNLMESLTNKTEVKVKK